MIANADVRPGLAEANAGRMAAAGYHPIVIGDSSQHLPGTLVYYRAEFYDAAIRVAADLVIPYASLLLISTNPTGPLTSSDNAGDVIVFLGADAPG